MFTIGTSSTIINLHRRFFQMHFHDPAYAAGVASTVSAAETILRSLMEIDEASLPDRRWWYSQSTHSCLDADWVFSRGVLYHAYRAGVILLLENQLKQERCHSAQLLEWRVKVLTTTISLLRFVFRTLFALRSLIKDTQSCQKRRS